MIFMAKIKSKKKDYILELSRKDSLLIQSKFNEMPITAEIRIIAVE